MMIRPKVAIGAPPAAAKIRSAMSILAICTCTPAFRSTLGFSMCAPQPPTPIDSPKANRSTTRSVQTEPSPCRGRSTLPRSLTTPEYLGEVNTCTTPGAEGFDTSTCVGYRRADADTVFDFGTNLTAEEPRRFTDVCGLSGERCRAVARDIWTRIQEAAENAYDRTSACSFTSFIGYEWTSVISASNLHRNIIFKNDQVPETVASYFEFPTVQAMHTVLESSCLEADTGCDAIAIPHNTNWSNGNMFFVEYPGARTAEEERALAHRRQRLEPLFEIYQHKGDAECSNGLSGVLGEPDELCRFEKLRPDPPDCGDGTGFGGAGGVGCVSRLDFLRGILLEGMKEEQRIGVNPYRLGVVASTDTHNGTPGEVSERDYPGHWGNNEDSVPARLGPNPITPGGVIYSGGGLTAAWAEQNTRESLFEAFRQREVYGTSGPRIVVRLFGGWDYPSDLCERTDFVSVGYADGVPMGSDLPNRSTTSTAPTFAVSAMMDSGTADVPGVPLERIQIVKGWLDSEGTARTKVYDVAGSVDDSTVDLNTCARDSRGASNLCTVWTDPEFDADEPAYYYARVVENPSCRWSWWACLSLNESERPPACQDDAHSEDDSRTRLDFTHLASPVVSLRAACGIRTRPRYRQPWPSADSAFGR